MSDIELTAKQRNKINRAIKSLNAARAEIQTENQSVDISWYLEDSNNLNLMGGNTHDFDNGGQAMHENVIDLFFLDNSSGGGW